VRRLDRRRVRTLVYNHQLCLIDEEVWPFAVKSISDWKNEYHSECLKCSVIERRRRLLLLSEIPDEQPYCCRTGEWRAIEASSWCDVRRVFEDAGEAEACVARSTASVALVSGVDINQREVTDRCVSDDSCDVTVGQTCSNDHTRADGGVSGPHVRRDSPKRWFIGASHQ
jgi:hypothetical protein